MKRKLYFSIGASMPKPPIQLGIILWLLMGRINTMNTFEIILWTIIWMVYACYTMLMLITLYYAEPFNPFKYINGDARNEMDKRAFQDQLNDCIREVNEKNYGNDEDFK